MALTLDNGKVKVTATTSGTAHTLYTATANQQKVTSILCANIDGTNSADISVFITSGGTDYYLASAIPVPAQDSLELVAGQGIMVKSGDVVKVFASAASDIDVILSVADIS